MTVYRNLTYDGLFIPILHSSALSRASAAISWILIALLLPFFPFSLFPFNFYFFIPRFPLNNSSNLLLLLLLHLLLHRLSLTFLFISSIQRQQRTKQKSKDSPHFSFLFLEPLSLALDRLVLNPRIHRLNKPTNLIFVV